MSARVAYITHHSSELVLNWFIQTWPLCGALTIFGQWIRAWQWVRTKPQLPRLLFAQGRSSQACRAGSGANCALPVQCGDGKEERNSTNLQAARKTWVQAADVSSGAAASLLTLSLSTRSWLSESFNRKRQSQQQRPERHLMEIFTDTNWKIQVHSFRIKIKPLKRHFTALYF